MRKACPMQMCVRVPRRDRILAGVCFSAFTICAALFVATAAFWFWMSTHVSASNFPLFSIVLTEFALGIGAAAIIQVSNENARNSVTKRSVIVCVAALLIVMIASRTWFDEPMHDLALDLGSLAQPLRLSPPSTRAGPITSCGQIRRRSCSLDRSSCCWRGEAGESRAASVGRGRRGRPLERGGGRAIPMIRDWALNVKSNGPAMSFVTLIESMKNTLGSCVMPSTRSRSRAGSPGRSRRQSCRCWRGPRPRRPVPK